MKTISATRFRTHCYRILEEVRREQKTVLITKRGRAVVKLVPVPERAVQILGDIESPAIPLSDWKLK